MNQFSGVKESVFFKDGVMDLEKYREFCIRYARWSTRVPDGYEEDFAQFCVEYYLEQKLKYGIDFWGFKKLTGRFFRKEFLGSMGVEPKHKLKLKSHHVPLHQCLRPLVDERTVELVKSFEERHMPLPSDGLVRGEMWFAFQQAITIQRKRAKVYRYRLKKKGQQVNFSGVKYMSGQVTSASKRLKKAR